MINISGCSNYSFDTIIIGAGGSGLMASLNLYDNDISNIAVISKVMPNYSHTVAAKGGINASLSNVENDNWLFHAYDTIKGSDYLADVDSVEILCSQAKQAILDLEMMGVAFSRDDFGKISQRAYGGQTKDFGATRLVHRACYAKDNTGNSIHRSLFQQCLKRDIKFFNEFFVIDIIINDNGKCLGCVAIDLNNGSIVCFQSKVVIVAGGGYSQIYNNTTSSTICTGDGLSAILRCGLPLHDMEFLQFHPTGIHNYGFLITEAARGEGGYLLNSKNERFLSKYEPNMMELASRDVVARAMATEVSNGFGCGANKDHLYLDLRHLGRDKLTKKLPGVIELVNKFCHLDPEIDLIPVSPSSHYTMGGIATSNNCFVLNDKNEEVDGLMAIGEAACVSIHGANRLGCNSLLDLIVFGKIAGEEAAKYIKNSSQFVEDKKFFSNKTSQIIANLFNQNSNKQVALDIESAKSSFQKFNDINLGVFRNYELLNSGYEYCQKLLIDLDCYAFKNKSLLWNEELILFLEFKNLVLCAYASYFSALNREESRGSHYRSDFKEKDDKKFLAHSVVLMGKKYNLSYSLKKVRKYSKYKELYALQ